MTMTNREWEALQDVQCSMKTVLVKVALIEEQVYRWRSRDKWLGRTLIGAAVGLVAWLIQQSI